MLVMLLRPGLIVVQYENMGVLVRMANGTRLRFVAPDEY